MPTKLKDVAKLADVSAATASRVLNGRSSDVRISEATKERIRHAAEELNYSPNRLARALRMQRTYVVGIVSSDANNPMSTTRLSLLDRLLTAKGYRTMVGYGQNDARRALQHVEDFMAAQVDGTILMASSYIPDGQRLIELRKIHGVPIVCIGRDLSREGIQSFCVDYYSGAVSITEHIIQLGYRRIAVIAGAALYEPESANRLEGSRQVCQVHGISITPELIVHEDEGGWNPHVGYRSMKQLLTVRPLPEAVVAFDDVTAYGAIRAIYEAGLRVPDDMAVVGFDDLAVSAFYNPPLTTVRQPLEEITAAAADFLIHCMEGQQVSPASCPRFHTQLVIRASAHKV